MRGRFPRILLWVPAALGLAGCSPTSSEDAEEAAPPDVMQGGETTVFDEGVNAFSLSARNLDADGKVRFPVGNSLFNQNWVTPPSSTTARDGLGPLFNARSCSSCHFKDGRGRPPEAGGELVSMLFRLSVPGAGPDGGPNPDPVYGGQLSGNAVLGAAAEGRAVIEYFEAAGAYPDGAPYSLLVPSYRVEAWAYGTPSPSLLISPRVAPGMVGLGLLEAIPEADILARVDEGDADGDGVSGRANYVYDVRAGGRRLGRFGWKANQPTVEQQVAGAFAGDIGITSSLFPGKTFTDAQPLDSLPSGGAPELADTQLDDVVAYSRELAVPARRNWRDPEVRKGSVLFDQAGCAACHVREQRTSATALPAALAGQTIHPYTDLLLHDMGDSLSDGRPDFLAQGGEWRTPPLWGAGLVHAVNGHTRFLHDGRARSLEEAVLWHGGEAASSRKRYREMSSQDRLALISFLKSL
ncbi:MAG TPA: di-heme oxidoredictase family protein [Fibrobacteria bacterium]|nr:di-heme oxidoredictase family protein [Fibrobacteria bacterium]